MLNIEIKFVAGNSTFTQVKEFPDSVTPKDISDWFDASKPHFEQVTTNVLTDRIVETDKTERLTTNVNVALHDSQTVAQKEQISTGIDQVLNELSVEGEVQSVVEQPAEKTVGVELESQTDDAVPTDDTSVIVESTSLTSETDISDLPVDLSDEDDDDLLTSSSSFI